MTDVDVAQTVEQAIAALDEGVRYIYYSSQDRAVISRSVDSWCSVRFQPVDAILLFYFLTSEFQEGVDYHPEKRVKAAWRAFEEARLTQMRQENPSLKLSQIRQMLRKEWQKSPLNPMNK